MKVQQNLGALPLVLKRELGTKKTETNNIYSIIIILSISQFKNKYKRKRINYRLLLLSSVQTL